MIFAILILGLVLRLISINQSLWLDEATTALVARNYNFGEIITKFSPGDFHPPLYYLVMRVWSLAFGTSEIALRLPSVIFGVLTIWLVYKISKSKLAALLTATSGLLVYYSQEARMYTMVALLVSCLVYLFIKKKWFWFSVFLLLVAATDYPALLTLPVFWILGKKYLRQLAVSHLLLAAGFIAWWPVLAKQLTAGAAVGGAWMLVLGQTNLKNLVLIPVKFILGRISFDNKVLYAAIAVVAVGFFGFLLWRARKSYKLIWLWLLVPIVLGTVISFKLPVLSYFRYLFVLPAFYILVAAGISTLKKPWFYMFACFVLSVNLLNTMYYILTPKFHREDWRGLAQALGSTKIVFPVNSQKEALIYYGKGGQIIDAQALSSNRYGQIWLSRYVWEIFDPVDTTRRKIESLGYQKTGEYNFNGVAVWKYVGGK